MGGRVNVKALPEGHDYSASKVIPVKISYAFQNVYKAKEDSGCCTRMFCGPTRPFDMVIKVR